MQGQGEAEEVMPCTLQPTGSASRKPRACAHKEMDTRCSEQKLGKSEKQRNPSPYNRTDETVALQQEEE